VRLASLLLVAFLASAGLSAQPIRTGLVRGVIVDTKASEFSVRSSPNQLYRFRFDAKTWIERAAERIPGSSLHSGELLEVVSDRDSQLVQYARLIHVLNQAVPRPPVREGMYRLYRSPAEEVQAPVLLTYSGVVSGKQNGSITVRTRFDGDKTIYIRPDTKCLNGGLEVSVATLEPNTRVSVQIGKNADGELEAYRVVWGRILEPATPR